MKSYLLKELCNKVVKEIQLPLILKKLSLIVLRGILKKLTLTVSFFNII